MSNSPSSRLPVNDGGDGHLQPSGNANPLSEATTIDVLIQWSFIRQEFHSNPCVQLCRVSEAVTTSLAIRTAREAYTKAQVQRPRLHRIFATVFARVVIGTAYLSDIEMAYKELMPRGSSFTEIYAYSFEANSVWTQAWHRALGPRHQSSGNENNTLTTPATTTVLGLSQTRIDRKVLVIKLALDELKITLFLLFVPIISGIVIGFGTGKVDVGISITSTLFAFVSSLHAAIELIKAKP
ncbi:hypothetical protein GQ44DRAFT_777480 [Phaeosphaeriaceae sp. PMI808]|nr:hypothetical protein GQ44DRAFT_777480 [Phaeosphaeriaceae sp. PMI808]